jgi:DMSO/TMAO reductase YedYZ molybdopterin-dependent catalytic subunit
VTWAEVQHIVTLLAAPLQQSSANDQAPLAAEHRFPVRLVIPGYYGTNAVTGLWRLELTKERASSPFKAGTHCFGADSCRGRFVTGIAEKTDAIHVMTDWIRARRRIRGWTISQTSRESTVPYCGSI